MSQPGGGTMGQVTIRGRRYRLGWARDSKGNLRPTLPLAAALTPEGKAILRAETQKDKKDVNADADIGT